MLDEAGYRRGMTRMIQLRWVVSAVLAAALVIAKVRAPGFPLALPVAVAFLVPLSNVGHVVLARRRSPSRPLLLLQFGCDLVLLTALLASTGGIDGPTAAPFVLHVLLGALLLPSLDAVLIGLGAVTLAASLALAQFELPFTSPGLFSLVMGIDPPLNRDPVAALGRVAMLTTVSAVTLFLVVPLVRDARRQSALLHETQAAATARLAILERLLDSLGASMMVLDEEHRLVWCNETARRWFGELTMGARRPCYSSKTGKTPNAPGGPPECVTCRVRDTSEPANAEYVSMETTGAQPAVIGVYATPLEEAGRRLSVELVRDVTGERRQEHRLRETRRAAAAAVIAAGIAHEMNTPLASLAFGLKTFAKASDAGDAGPRNGGGAMRDLLRDLVAQVERCQKITDSMLGHSRQFHAHLGAAGARDIVDDAIFELASRRDLSGIEIDLVDRPGASRQVVCDPDLLRVALLNLLSNAVDSLHDREQPKVRIEIVSASAETVEIRIEDNGVGMSDEVKAKALDPFFTTKAGALGTGLGLPLTEGLLEAMRGTMVIESELGAGTRVAVRLKAAQPSDPRATPTRRAERRTG